MLILLNQKQKPLPPMKNGRVVFRAKIKADLMLDAVEKGHITTLTNKHLEDIRSLLKMK